MITDAIACDFSSDNETKVLYFFFINFLIIFLLAPFMFKIGLPFLLFVISISLKFNPLETPVPKALEKASLAANLFA